MTPWLFVIGACGVMVTSYLVVTRHMSRRNGLQPGKAGLVIMVTTLVCFLTGFFVLRRFGIDLFRGRPRDVLWGVLGIVWLASAVRIAYERRASGAVLLDLGRVPMFRLWMFFSVVMLAIGIGNAFSPASRVQGFAYIAWSAWFFAMARGRFQVRERGIITGDLLPWRRITGCVATAENAVRLNLTKKLQRNVDIKLPPDLRDKFIELVDARMG